MVGFSAPTLASTAAEKADRDQCRGDEGDDEAGEQP
jgi:hypothetical protein